MKSQNLIFIIFETIVFFYYNFLYYFTIKICKLLERSTKSINFIFNLLLVGVIVINQNLNL